jgi:hypothetical protein
MYSFLRTCVLLLLTGTQADRYLVQTRTRTEGSAVVRRAKIPDRMMPGLPVFLADVSPDVAEKMATYAEVVSVERDHYDFVLASRPCSAKDSTQSSRKGGGGKKTKSPPPPAPEDQPSRGDSVPLGVQRAFGGVLPMPVFDPSSVAVCVLDELVDAKHPDLNIDRVICGQYSGKCTPGNHGTHVAGTIGASGGISGVAPGVRLHTLQVCGGNGCSYSDIVRAVDIATTQALCQVINLSLGGFGSAGTCGSGCTACSSALRTAICWANASGITVVAAAGNMGSDTSGFVPANYPETIAVSALADSDGTPGGVGSPVGCTGDPDDTLAHFSNYNADVAAPGTCVNSTLMRGTYGSNSGTSMAAPHVAGAAARLHAQGMSHAEVRRALTVASDGACVDATGWRENSTAVDACPVLDLSKAGCL